MGKFCIHKVGFVILLLFFVTEFAYTKNNFEPLLLFDKSIDFIKQTETRELLGESDDCLVYSIEGTSPYRVAYIFENDSLVRSYSFFLEFDDSKAKFMKDNYLYFPKGDDEYGIDIFVSKDCKIVSYLYLKSQLFPMDILIYEKNRQHIDIDLLNDEGMRDQYKAAVNSKYKTSFWLTVPKNSHIMEIEDIVSEEGIHKRSF